MTVQLSALRVSADLDASGYVQGASQVTRADQEMIAGARQVSVALTDQQGKVSAAGNPLARLSRQYIDGYGATQRFESGLRSLNRMLERNEIEGRQAEAVYTGMAQKLGLVANAADITAQGYGRLGGVIDTVNAKLAQQSTLAATAATGLGRIGASDNDNSFRRRNLTYQAFDVVQMAALGQAPMMTALQQGPQIAQLYAGPGGVAAAMSDARAAAAGLARFLPTVGAAALGVGLAFKGITDEAERATGQTVTFGETAKAVFAIAARAADPLIEKLTTVAEKMAGWAGDKLITGLDMAANMAGNVGYEAAFHLDPNNKGTLEDYARRDEFWKQNRTPLRSFAGDVGREVVDRKAAEDMDAISKLKFGDIIGQAGSLRTQVAGVGEAAGIAHGQLSGMAGGLVSVDQGLTAAARGMAALGQADQMQKMRFELRDTQAELAKLRVTSANYGDNIVTGSAEARNALEITRAQIMATADGVAAGNVSWQTLDMLVETARRRLLEFGLSSDAVNDFVDKVTKAAFKTEDLENRILGLNQALGNIPRDIRINISENITRTTTNGVNVYRSNGGSDAGSSSPSASLAADSAWDRDYDKFRDAQMNYDRAHPFGPSAKLQLDVSGRDVTGIGAGYYATGGLIRGPGTGTSDSILSRLSNGEYVIRASSVSKYGTEMFDQLNRGALPAFADGGSVGGGSVPILGMGTLSEIEVNTALTVEQIERLIGITNTMSGDILAMLRRSQASASASLGSRATGSGGAATGGVGGGIWMEPTVKAINTGYGAFVPGKTGYATGGVIPPSGSGSTDTRYMEFMARPDETISIHTPAQRKAVVDALERGGEGTSIIFGDVIIQLPAGADARQGQQAGRAAADEFKRRVGGALSRFHG